MDLFSIGGALLGGLASGNSSGQTQTQSRDPWGPSQDWLKQNITSGQNLQNWYQLNPISAQQQAAYGNQVALGEQVRRTMPGLLANMSGTQFFDRSQPLNRPTPYQFTAGGGLTGGLSNSAYGGLANPFSAIAPTVQPTVQKPVPVDYSNNAPNGGISAAPASGDFTLQDIAAAISGMSPGMAADVAGAVASADAAASGNDGSSGVAWAKGGEVKGKLLGPKPAGPDDGYGALQRGEFVVKKSVAQKHKGLLKDLNDGKVQIKGGKVTRGLMAC